MTESMIERIALALTPHIHHGISDPEEAALAVIAAIRNPTDRMVDAGERTATAPCEGVSAALVWAAMIEAAMSEKANA